MSKHKFDSAHFLTMSDQQPAMHNCSAKSCRNTLLPNDGRKMCLEHREKEKQHKKKARALMKWTRDNAELSDAPPEVPQMSQENAPDSPPPWKGPKVCINH